MLSQLKSADTLEKFAAAIRYKTSGLSFILYKLPEAAEYQTFDIPKASGGMRTIHAPTEKLKRLQGRLATVLLECNSEEFTRRTLYPHSPTGLRKEGQFLPTHGSIRAGDMYSILMSRIFSPRSISAGYAVSL